MKINIKLVSVGAALALGLAPVAAKANPSGHGHSGSAHGGSVAALSHAGGHKGSNSHSTTSPGKAYGKLCRGESRKHVAGTPGTPFSACVKAMAQLATGSDHSPRAACASESKRHVAGQSGTPFSQCVRAAAKLRSHDASGGDDSGSDSPSGTDTTGSGQDDPGSTQDGTGSTPDETGATDRAPGGGSPS